MSRFGRFFLPGPTEVRPEVLDAMREPMIGHRGPEMEELLTDLDVALKHIFRTNRTVLIGACSATGFMEMAVRNGVRQRCLSLVSGAFGERFAKIAEACGKDVVRLEVQPGRTVEADHLRDALMRTPVDAVTLVHSETSTGALAPLKELVAVTREFDDVMVLVDAVTSMAGSPVETDAWGLDFVLTGSQKALALPPGLAFGAASSRMLERAGTLNARGSYFDLVAFEAAFAKAQPTNTPAVSLLYALRQQTSTIVEQGGIEARWDRHAAMQRRVEAWVQTVAGSSGMDLLPDVGRRSWTVSCLTLPENQTSKPIVAGLRERGIVIGSGYGSLKEASIRIGHMGDHSVEELDIVLAALEEIML